MRSVTRSTDEGPILYLEIPYKEVEELFYQTTNNGYNCPRYDQLDEHLRDFLMKNYTSRIPRTDRMRATELPEEFRTL
jgi:hypothetical protein